MIRVLATLIGMTLAGCATAVTEPPAAGVVLRAIDGDTLALGAERIRLIGVDTPELRGARCTMEWAKAEEARVYVQRALNGARSVDIERREVEPPKRYGRTLAIVRVDGADLAALLIKEGLGRPYDGRGKRRPWC